MSTHMLANHIHFYPSQMNWWLDVQLKRWRHAHKMAHLRHLIEWFSSSTIRLTCHEAA